MLFSSPVFFLFFAIYFALHLIIPARHRLYLIIAGSIIFYGYWNPAYMWIPFFLTLIAYYGAIWMVDGSLLGSQKRRMWVVVSLILIPLLIVKYSNFIYLDVLGFSTPLNAWALPLGISFISFTLVAYVVDVYRGKFQIERQISMLAGLVLFFPHLIAGPILRPHELLPQIHRPRRATQSRILAGLSIFTWGLFKKLVFADSLAGIVDATYASSAAGLNALDYLLAIYAFSIQIYCDFSGYTDMAIGTAIMLGVKLPTNFNKPYASLSIIEFWRRWHITLSTWLRDYIYVPMGGGRNGYFSQARNILLTMSIGGLWHGASWHFLFWGIAHGCGICIAHAFRKIRLLPQLKVFPRWVYGFLTFNFVTFCWILFRAPSMEKAILIARGPFEAAWPELNVFASNHLFELLLLIGFVFLNRWDNHKTLRRIVFSTNKYIYWPILVLFWILAISVSQGSSSNFIYFDF